MSEIPFIRFLSCVSAALSTQGRPLLKGGMLVAVGGRAKERMEVRDVSAKVLSIGIVYWLRP